EGNVGVRGGDDVGGRFGGETGMWYMNNNNFVGALNGPSLPANWDIMAVADFNGDGHPDLVLQGGPLGNQTAIWYMNNNNFLFGKFGPTLPVFSGWFVMAAADMNGDGHPDFVLFNFVTPQTAIWYMNNNIFVGALSGPPLPSSSGLFGVADFNGDGDPDFLLRRFGVDTRKTGIWYMNNNNFVGALFGPTLPVGWFFLGVADFNIDGHPDFVFVLVIFAPFDTGMGLEYMSESNLVGG